MSQYILHKVNIEADLGDTTGCFCESYITEEPNVKFLSINEKIDITSTTSTPLENEVAEHFIKHLGGIATTEFGFIEVNGEPLEDTKYDPDYQD